MQRNSAALAPDGNPVGWLGANYWSRTGGPLMWRRYDPAVVRGELAVLAAHGLALTRSFFYWPDFMPEPERVDETMAARFADFLDLHTAAGLGTIPTFIVGHMSGENWDPAWRDGRDLYGDVWMVGRQAWFAGEMVRRFHRHPAVRGWLVSNEMPIYGDPAPREEVRSWAQLIVTAIRAAGATQPVSLGDGAWGIENTGVDNGFSVRDCAELCDFLGPHVYRMENDVVRQHYAAAWACELTATFGRPVVLEEFGVSSDFVSDANAAHYYRQTLHNSLLAGATGWIAWNNCDYDDLADQDPYRHHPFEMHFGLTDRHGVPKPQLREMKAFAELADAVDLAGCVRADTDTALVVSSYLDTEYPFTVPEDRTHLDTTLRQAYVAARHADLAPGVSRESDGIATDARLYLVPSTKQLLSPTWRQLESLAREGACIYVSYCPGPHPVQRGPWYADLDSLFGVEHQLVYGLVNPITEDDITFTVTRDFGTLRAGEKLSFRAAGTADSRAYLPVRPVDAEVIAVDAHGRPALVERRVGEGSMVLCTYPIEHMAALTPRVNPEHTGRLYEALAVHARARRPIVAHDPRVAADVLRHRDGGHLAFLVSQADDVIEVEVSLAPGLKLTTLDGSPVDKPVSLDAYGVGVFRLHGSENSG